jgi:hypothetical protein
VTDAISSDSIGVLGGVDGVSVSDGDGAGMSVSDGVGVTASVGDGDGVGVAALLGGGGAADGEFCEQADRANSISARDKILFFILSFLLPNISCHIMSHSSVL